MTLTRPGAAARAYSSLKMTCSVMVAPRPPCSTGQPRQVQPPPASTFSQRRRTSKPKVSSPEPPRPPSSANSPTRCSCRKSRTSWRNATSSGRSRRSIAGERSEAGTPDLTGRQITAGAAVHAGGVGADGRRRHLPAARRDAGGGPPGPEVVQPPVGRVARRQVGGEVAEAGGLAGHGRRLGEPAGGLTQRERARGSCPPRGPAATGRPWCPERRGTPSCSRTPRRAGAPGWSAPPWPIDHARDGLGHLLPARAEAPRTGVAVAIDRHHHDAGPRARPAPRARSRAAPASRRDSPG